MKIIRDDEAVSPVIGVILMVAITVILAAVIAAFVFGLAGTTGSSKNVGLTVSANGTTGFLTTIQGGTDLPTMTELNWSTDGSTFNAYFGDTGGSYEVGQVLWANSAANSNVRLIIRGTFNDGSQQVLFDRQY